MCVCVCVSTCRAQKIQSYKSKLEADYNNESKLEADYNNEVELRPKMMGKLKWQLLDESLIRYDPSIPC